MAKKGKIEIDRELCKGNAGVTVTFFKFCKARSHQANEALAKKLQSDGSYR
jgi:hypothetical protein